MEPVRATFPRPAAGRRKPLEHLLKVKNQVLTPFPGHLFFVVEQNTEVKCLVDAEAQISVAPLSTTERKFKNVALSLQTIDGSGIAMYRKKSLTLNVGFPPTFCWIFLIADTHHPTLGADSSS